MLVSGGSGGKKSRLTQVLEWCNSDGEFDGIIVFDESHKAKNVDLGSLEKGDATRVRGDSADDGSVKRERKSTKNKSSITAMKVLELQERLPRARVVYVSATGASYLYQMG